MALPRSELIFSEEEYLALEREAEERHEYLDGHIYAMAGESGAHADICVNLTRIVSTQLLGKPCRVRSKDTKVRSGRKPRNPRYPKGMYSYPDLVVICGEPQYHDQYRDVVLNPQVIIEVLSDSTEAFDRGEKFRRYRVWLPSLTDYVVVAQNMPLIEYYARPPNGQWVIAASVAELSDSVYLESIDCTLRLNEVYDRIEFPPEEEETESAADDE
ncbi:MAG TPA: Uma2 family endonuclease [Blastocatellia bacterium]|nr:Uma2 family endonuclease [Blastocatellia bacterium]